MVILVTKISSLSQQQQKKRHTTTHHIHTFCCAYKLRCPTSKVTCDKILHRFLSLSICQRIYFPCVNLLNFYSRERDREREFFTLCMYTNFLEEENANKKRIYISVCERFLFSCLRKISMWCNISPHATQQVSFIFATQHLKCSTTTIYSVCSALLMFKQQRNR